jgi:outer membrane receptor for ferrienterochelin and colicin
MRAPIQSRSQLTYRVRVPHAGALTLGATGQWDLRALQSSVKVAPVYQELSHTNKRDKLAAVFAQDELELSRHWKLDVGSRLDYSKNRQNSVSPRAAFIYPRQMTKLHVVVPMFKSGLSLAGTMQYKGARNTLAGATLTGVLLTDIVVSSRQLTRNMGVAAGIRNLANVKYQDPIALNSRVDTLSALGRSAFLSVTWRFANSN